jgi:hypothetical protein
MKQKITTLIVTSLMALGIYQVSTAQTVNIITQDFSNNTFPPPQTTPLAFPNWTVSGVGLWSRQPNGTNPNCTPHSAPAMARFASNFLFFPPAATNLYLPPINFTTYPGGTKTISFWMFHDAFVSGINDRIIVIANTIASDVGVNASILGTVSRSTVLSGFPTGWSQHTFSVPSTATYNTSNTVYLMFRGISGGGFFNSGNNMFIDDVSVDYTPPPCSGTPTAGIVTPSPLAVCPNTPFSLTMTGATSLTNITYTWQAALLSSPTLFNNVPGGNTNVLTMASGITVPTIFRCKVTCTSLGGNTVYTLPDTVSIKPFYLCYCQPPTPPVLGGSNNPYITNVSISGTPLNNLTPFPIPGNYAFFNPPTATQTCNLRVGGVYTLNTGYSGNAKGGMWIDFNRNGVFADVANEFTQINNTGNSANRQFFVPVASPVNTTPTGQTVMRIRTTVPNATNGAANPCTTNANGQTQDYLINILPANAIDLAVTAITQPNTNLTNCGFGFVPVRVAIYNAGTTALTNFPVTAQYTGPSGNTVTTNYNFTLNPFTRDTIQLGYISPSLIGTYVIKAWGVVAGDQDHTNDTTVKTFTVAANPPLPIVSNDTVCNGQTATITADPVAGFTNYWYTSATSTAPPAFIGDSRTFTNLTHDTTFYVAKVDNGLVVDSIASSLTGTTTSAGGVMFNISPASISEITLDSFAAKFSTGGMQQVLVYYRPGGFAGAETNQLAWSYMGSAMVNATANGISTFSTGVPFVLTPGTVYGIYLKYNAVTTNSANTYTNLDMLITNGSGLSGLFSGLSINKEFNGKLFYHRGSGCVSARVAVTAGVGLAPVVNLGNDTSICLSQPLTLDAGIDNANYLWSTGETSKTITISSMAPGSNPHTYSVSVTKYCTSSDGINVTVVPNPSIDGIGYVQNDQTFTFSAVNPQYVTAYFWDFGDGANDVIQNPVHHYYQNAVTGVTLYIYNSCGVDTIKTTVLPTDVPSVISADHNISIFPNPAINTIKVQAMNNVKFSNITIINNIGQVVYTESCDDLKSHDLNISSLPSGYYIMRVNASNGDSNLPFIIKK